MPAARDVILYELNEVPWTVVDHYVGRRPDSNLAKALAKATSETTVDHEDTHLSPWRTWPSFHKGLPVSEHNSRDLGQDPDTFRGDNIWDVAERAGLKIGLFGPMQSWPAHEPKHGGFYVPDTFSRDAQTFPPSLSRFQAFNLSQTKEQGFSSDARLSPREMAGAGLDLLTKGLSPWSARMIVRQLLRERRDPRHKAARAIFQALPSFDLYWRLHRRERPNLSVFFTNHLASMMHRYWGDALPEYAAQFDYEPDEVFATFVPQALDVFDHQLGIVMDFVDKNPNSVLMVASSMGQEPIEPKEMDVLYVVKDPRRLAEALELGPAEPGLAMYPEVALQLGSPQEAEAAVGVLESVRVPGGDPIFNWTRVSGRTVHVSVDLDRPADPSGRLEYATATNGDSPATASVDELGIATEKRLGGSNTAYHCPDGILITYGAGIERDSSRREVDLFDVAPRILEILGVRSAAGSA